MVKAAFIEGTTAEIAELASAMGFERTAEKLSVVGVATKKEEVVPVVGRFNKKWNPEEKASLASWIGKYGMENLDVFAKEIGRSTHAVEMRVWSDPAINQFLKKE